MWRDSLTYDMTHYNVTCQWVMSHHSYAGALIIHKRQDSVICDMTQLYVTWLSPLRHVTQSCLAWLRHMTMSHVTSVSHVSHISAPCHMPMSDVTYQWVMSHINESCHIYMSHVTHISESCQQIGEPCHVPTSHVTSVSHVTTHISETCCHTYQ